MHNDLNPPLQYHTEQSRCPVSPPRPTRDSLAPGKHWSSVSLAVPFPECHSVGVPQRAACSVGFVHLAVGV